METQIEFTAQNEYIENKVFQPDIETTVSLFSENRVKLKSMIEELGLSPEFFKWVFEQPILVGPAEQSFPLTTLFDNNPFLWRMSIDNSIRMANGFKANGMDSKPCGLVFLNNDKVPKDGNKSNCFLTVPKGTGGVERIFLNGSFQMREKLNGVPFAKLNIPITYRDALIQEIRNSSDVFRSIAKGFPYDKEIIIQTISAVLSDIWGSVEVAKNNGCFNYIKFINAFNNATMSRAFGLTLPMTPLDSRYYMPFLQDGITDWVKFLGTLKSLGVVLDNKPVFNQIDTELDRVYPVNVKISKNIVQFLYENGEVFYTHSRYDKLRKKVTLVPAKRLAYFLVMGSFMPFVYYADDSGDIYDPYVETPKLLSGLGLNCVAYPFRPTRKKYPILPDNTIFDFYLNCFNLNKFNSNF